MTDKPIVNELCDEIERLRKSNAKLLAACEEALPWINSHCPDPYWASDAKERDDLIEQLKAALMEGERPWTQEEIDDAKESAKELRKLFEDVGGDE